MYEELIKRLREYSTARKGEIAELTEEAADAIEELNRFKEECDACPICGNRLLANGRPFKSWWPKWYQHYRQNHGITCVLCGFSAKSVKAWNRRVDNG